MLVPLLESSGDRSLSLSADQYLTSPAEFVMLIASILANYALLPRREGLAADDQKGNINCYRGPVHRNEGVETDLRDI